MISLFIFTSNIRGMNYGIGTYVSELTSGLLKYPDIRIYHVTYNSNHVREFAIHCSKNKVVSIHIPGPKNPIITESQILKYSARVVDFLAEIFEKTFNVVIQVNYPSSLSIVKEIKKRYKFPILSVIHSANWQFLTIGNKKKFINVWDNKEEYDKNTLKELLEEKELYELADKIVSVTGYMKKFISDYYKIDPNKASVIQNGMDFSKFKILGKSEKSILKKQLGFKPVDRIVVFAGRLDNGKGLHFLLMAFNEVFTKDKNVKLVIIGEESGTESIRQFLSYLKDSWHNVTFTGFLRHSDVLKFYQIADVGIIPSIYDHCPYAAIEMAAHNIPLIISDTEGLNEMFSEEQAVYLRPFCETDGSISFGNMETADTILALIGDKKKRNKMGKNYGRLIKTKFSGERMAKEMHDILESLFIP